MKPIHLLFAALCWLCLPAAAQDAAPDFTAYERRWWIQGGDTLPYRLLLPKDYDAGKAYPLVLFLHGAGERGRDNEAQLKHGGSMFLRDSVRQQFPAIVVFPQCPAAGFWAPVSFGQDSTGGRTFHFPPNAAPTRPMALVLELLDQLQHHYKLDPKRLYVGGLSMGAMGTYDLVARKPKTFAAAVAICGGGAPEQAGRLRHTNWWVCHGSADPVVPWQLSEQMVNAIRKQRKSSVLFTLYKDVGHDSWDNAFASPGLLPWLFHQQQ